MKHLALLAYSLLITVSASAYAADGHTCLEQSAGLSGPDRTAFLKGCLGQNRSPANTEEVAMQGKRVRCEQNAKNKTLHGADAANYVNDCINRNDAKEARARIAANHDAPPALAAAAQ